MLQPQTNVENLSLESFCGRRKWRRRQHRPAYTIPENQISFATMNVQSLRLDLIAHRDKLRDLILRLREFKIHLCCLQEMHSFSSETLVDYVEEYCFVARGRVAVVLINGLAQAWEQAGRQLLFRRAEDSDCILTVIFPYREQRLSVTAVYIPHSNRVGDKRAQYTQCQIQHRELSQRQCTQLWGGDWNGHVAKGDGPSPHCGSHGLAQPPTTTGGKLFLEWLVTTQLTVADTKAPVASRGT